LQRDTRIWHAREKLAEQAGSDLWPMPGGDE
jgi:hypothetical protein